MTPKYRGDSEDWLDNEKALRKKSAGHRKKKEVVARSLGLPWENANAVVSEVFPNQCKVWLDDGRIPLLCAYKRAEVVSKTKGEGRERTPVAVGDRVLVRQTDSTSGVVEGICARKNCISRPAPGRETNRIHHVLAANIDVLVIVASYKEPVFSPGLVDRFLIAAEVEGIQPLICVSKTDLVQPAEENNPPWGVYKGLGYDVVEISSKTLRGITELSTRLEDKVVVFCGQSGVGKTSLLRCLLGTDVGKIGAINEATGKGRHTTTGAVLLGGPEDSHWIDTPGVREFGLLNITPDHLADCFPELKSIQCKISGCLHMTEEGCLARDLPRYSSYARIFQSLTAGEG